ncbi:RHS repeat domain-containing protein [Paenibacillus tritici]|uniref:RHS repeat domain-containing protein n=1 Tax=Paenibacillus tritici TaxID=1873425 RepID=UPI001FE29608|nr:RHS repeat-associated core domain-containing protein [Paenibacillus tritici]
MKKIKPFLTILLAIVMLLSCIPPMNSTVAAEGASSRSKEKTVSQESHTPSPSASPVPSSISERSAELEPTARPTELSSKPPLFPETPPVEAKLPVVQDVYSPEQMSVIPLLKLQTLEKQGILDTSFLLQSPTLQKQMQQKSLTSSSKDLSQKDIEQLIAAGASKEDVYWINLLQLDRPDLTPLALLKQHQEGTAWEEIQSELYRNPRGFSSEHTGVSDAVYLQERILFPQTYRTVTEEVYRDEPEKAAKFSKDQLEWAASTVTAFDRAYSGVIEAYKMAQINQSNKRQYEDRSSTTEVVDPISGSLTWKQNQIHLPGRDGLDLDIGLMYKSNQTPVFEWVTSTTANPYLLVKDYYSSKFNLGTGWALQFPSIQADNGRRYYHDGKGSVFLTSGPAEEMYGLTPYTGFVNYYGRNMRYSTNSTQHSFSNGQTESSQWVEYLDGRREYFSISGDILGIEDRFGNTITFNYNQQDQLISSITDSVGRKVTFSYEHNLNTTDVFTGEDVVIRVLDGEREVEKVTLKKWRVSQPVNWTGEKIDPVMMPYLSSVENQAGEYTTFDYDVEFTQYKPDSGYSGPQKLNYYAMLKNIKYPRSSTAYEYKYTTRNYAPYDTVGDYQVKSKKDMIGSKTYNQVDYQYNGNYTGNTPEQYPGNLPDDFRYGTTAKIISTTPSNNMATTQTFDRDGRLVLTETAAANGERKEVQNTAFDTTFIYSPTKSTITEYGAGGAANSLYSETVYNDYGLVASQTGPLTAGQAGNPSLKQHYSTTYTYEPNYQFPASKSWYQDESDAAPLIESYTYTAQGRPATVINAKNEQMSFSYSYVKTDNQDKLEQTTAETRVDNRLIAKSVVRYGSENNYAYPTEQQQWFNIGTADEKAVTTKTVYNKGNGQVIQKTEANNQTVAYEYDGAGRLKKETYPIKTNTKGQQIQEIVDYNYYNQSSPNFDATNAGTQVLKVDSITTVTNITSGTSMKTYRNVLYDGLGLTLLEEHYDENVNKWVFTQYHYDDQGRPVYSINPAGNILTASYDAWGRQNRATTPSGDVMVSDYDLGSRTATSYIQDQATGQALNYVQESYDSKGNKLSASTYKDWPTKQQPISESYRYNIAGQVIGYTDPNHNLNEDGVTNSYRYDALGRLTALKDALNQTTNYSYDGNGQVSKVTIQAKGGTPQTLNTKTYNELGLPSVKQDGSSQSESYTYNSAGQLADKTDRNGSSFTYTYDEAGQMKTSTIRGILNNVEQTQETKMITGDGSPDKQTILTFTNGIQTASHTQTQNSLGQLRSTFSESGGHTAWVGNQLDVLGRMTQISDQYMSFFTNYTYQQQRLTQVQTNGSAVVTGSATANAQYTYFGNDSVKSITYPTLTDGSQLITTYTYNKALGWTERMENTKGGGSLSSYSYSYDNNGNRIAVSESRNEGAEQRTNYGYDALNRLISISRPDGGQTTYTYDVRGNRLTLSDTSTVSLDAADTSYTYDLQNTLTSVTKGGASTSFKYYADGMRSMKTKGNTQTQVNYDFQGQVISEEKIVNGDYVEQANFVRGDRVLVKKDKKAAKDYYYLYNGHGDVVQIVDTNGKVVNNYTYDEWGNITSQKEEISNSFKYTGEVYDEETGLYYLRARYYDPSMGRFLNEDTVEGQIDNPLSQNLYTYVHNNPLIYTDPTGMCVAGKDSGCYLDSFSGVDGLIDNPGFSNNTSMWGELQRYINNYCSNASCVAKQQAKQKTLEKANDAIRNNVCSYVDCSIGEASFILENNKAIGVRIKVEIADLEPGFWGGLGNYIMPTAYASELPPKTLGSSSFGYIEHYYKSGDHAPAHVHVIDNKGNVVRVGQNGKPLEGEPELNRAQQMLVTQYRPQIRSSVSRIMKWYRYNNPNKYEK